MAASALVASVSPHHAVNFEDFRAVALALPGVEEYTSFGTPAFRVRGKMLARLREDGVLVLKPIEDAEQRFLMETRPGAFFSPTTIAAILRSWSAWRTPIACSLRSSCNNVGARSRRKKMITEYDEHGRGRETMTEYALPIPEADEESRAFYEGARRHELMLMRCRNCGAWRLPSRPRCPDCWSTDTEWARASGRGILHSFGIMHQKLHPAFAERDTVRVCRR